MPRPNLIAMTTPEAHTVADRGLAKSKGPCVLAFDVGGTWVKYGIVDAQGRMLFSDQLATQSEPDGKALLTRLLAVAAPLVARHAPAGIAFSTLGIIDPAEGRLVGAVEAIAGYFGQSPKASFENAFQVPVGLRLYMGQHATRYDLMMAAAVVSVIPVLLTFFASQRWFIKGLAAGAVKG